MSAEDDLRLANELLNKVEFVVIGGDPKSCSFDLAVGQRDSDPTKFCIIEPGFPCDGNEGGEPVERGRYENMLDAYKAALAEKERERCIMNGKCSCGRALDNCLFMDGEDEHGDIE